MIEEVTEKAGFWILGGGGTIAVVLGWIMGKRAEWELLPLWQLIAIIVAIWIASAVFSLKD